MRDQRYRPSPTTWVDLLLGFTTEYPAIQSNQSGQSIYVTKLKMWCCRSGWYPGKLQTLWTYLTAQEESLKCEVFWLLYLHWYRFTTAHFIWCTPKYPCSVACNRDIKWSRFTSKLSSIGAKFQHHVLQSVWSIFAFHWLRSQDGTLVVKSGFCGTSQEMLNLCDIFSKWNGIFRL